MEPSLCFQAVLPRLVLKTRHHCPRIPILVPAPLQACRSFLSALTEEHCRACQIPAAHLRHLLELLLPRLALERRSEEAGESRHRYVYAIALHDTGKLEQALTVLERLNTDLPGNPEVLYALIGYAKALGDGAKAGRYSAQLQAIVQTAGLR